MYLITNLPFLKILILLLLIPHATTRNHKLIIKHRLWESTECWTQGPTRLVSEYKFSYFSSFQNATHLDNKTKLFLLISRPNKSAFAS